MEQTIAIQNRNQAYLSIIDDLPNRRKRVFDIIKLRNNITCQEIADYLGLTINCISGRVTELKQQFLIVESGSKRINRHSYTTYRLMTKAEMNKLWDKTYLETIELRDRLVNDFHNMELCNDSKELLHDKIKKLNKKLLMLHKLSRSWK